MYRVSLKKVGRLTIFTDAIHSRKFVSLKDKSGVGIIVDKMKYYVVVIGV